MSDNPYQYSQAPGAKAVRYLLWGMVAVERKGYHDSAYRIVWKRTSLILICATFLGWVFSAEAYYFNQRYMSGITTTRRADMYLYFPESFLYWCSNLPLSREEIRHRDRASMVKEKASYGRLAHLQRKGDFYVSIAKAAYDRQDYAEFAKYIGTGAYLSPSNLEAQKMCASLFFAFGRTLDAYELLEESLEYAKQDPDYFHNYLVHCFMLDQDQRVINVAKKYLPQPDLAPAVRSELLVASAQANLLRGNFNETGKIVKDNQLLNTLDGLIIYCQMLWESGDREAALELVSEGIQQHPEAKILLSIKAKWLQENGNFAAARDCLDLLTIAEPNKPGPAIQSLYLMSGEKNQAKRHETIEQLIQKYGGSEQTMLELASYANNAHDIELSARLLKLAQKNTFSNRLKFTLTHVECLINAGKARDCIRIVDELYHSTERSQWPADINITFDALRTVAYFSDGQLDIGEINLHRLLENKNLPPQLLLTCARKLIEVGRFDEANDILIQTHLQNENNQAVLLQIVRLKLENRKISDDLEIYLKRLMATRRPPKEVLLSAKKSIGSDLFLFSPQREKLLDDIDKLLK
jgi:thioredoxin-like negative regulator of GroEL